MSSATKNQSHIWIEEISENQKINGSYMVKEKRAGTTRKGDPFLSLVLADRTGEVEARIWEGADELAPLFSEGDIVHIEGHSSSYRGKLQLTLSNLEVSDSEVDLAVFLESSDRDTSEMMKALRRILNSLDNVHLKALIDRFLNDRQFVSQFEKTPAAKNFHHSYVGGLLEHTLAVCRLAVRVAELYPELDRDLLISAAFLHDIGKIKEFNCNHAIDYSDEGRLLGHVVLGVAMLEEKLRDLKKFPVDLSIRLKHLILSHHGQYEFGSPKRPKFLEAFALNFMDDLDAKMNGLSRFMEKDRQDGAWTDYNRMFERFLLKGEMTSSGEGSLETDETDERQGSLFNRSTDS